MLRAPGLPPMTPAMALAAACSRPASDLRRDALVRDCAAAITDWSAVQRMLVRQRVEGLAQSSLRRAGVRPPDDFAGWMNKRVRWMQMQGLKLSAESVRLQRMLDVAGIDNLIVKGAPLTAQAWGAGITKYSKDIDLLVEIGDVERAKALLEEDGYVLSVPAKALSSRQLKDVIRHSRDIALVNRQRGVQVELHWRLTDNPMVLPQLRIGAVGTMMVPLDDGLAVRTLGSEALFPYLCAHGASHGWVRLKWLADLVAYLATDKHLTIEQHLQAARNADVGECAGQALLLGRHYLGLDLPDALVQELERNRRVVRLANVAAGLMAGPGADREISARPGAQTRLIFARLLMSRDWRDLLFNIRLHLVAMEDVLSLPLPTGLQWLYPLIRLPSWMIRQVRSRFAPAGRTA